ncbi:MAG: hypothetical protein ACRC39_01760 [Enterobacter sp.]
MNNETMITIVLAIAVLAVSYYFYRKIQSQEQTILTLTKKCEDLELMFKPVAPASDLKNIYKRNFEQDEDEECINGLCDLQPMNIEINKNQFENIAMMELENVKNRKKSSPKSIRSSRRSSISK